MKKSITIVLVTLFLAIGCLAFPQKPDISKITAIASSDNYVYTNSADGRIICFNVADGNVVWEYKTDDTFVSNPLICDGILYCLSNRNELVYSFDINSGKKLDIFENVVNVREQWVLENHIIFSSEKSLSCFDRITKREKWNIEKSVDTLSKKQTVNDLLLISDYGKAIAVINADTGKVEDIQIGEIVDDFKVIGGRLFVFDRRHFLRVVDLATKQNLWKYQCKSNWGDVIVNSDRVFLKTKVSIECLQLSTGKRIWTVDAKIDSKNIVYCNGKLIYSNKTDIWFIDELTGKPWGSVQIDSRDAGQNFISNGNKIYYIHLNQLMCTGMTTLARLWTVKSKGYWNLWSNEYIFSGNKICFYTKDGRVFKDETKDKEMRYTELSKFWLTCVDTDSGSVVWQHETVNRNIHN